MNQQAQPGDTIVAAAGAPPGDLHKLWDVSNGRQCQLEFGYSCMGYEIPAGLGARIAQPAGEVYVFIGDGTYLMNPSELVTAVQHGLKITLVVSENHGYQCIRQLQLARAGRAFGNEFRHRTKKTNRLDGSYVEIDLAANAASFGARAWHCRTEDEVKTAFAEARLEARPCAIVVETEADRPAPSSEMWMDVAPAEVSNDPIVRKVRKQYEAERRAGQRLYY